MRFVKDIKSIKPDHREGAISRFFVLLFFRKSNWSRLCGAVIPNFRRNAFCQGYKIDQAWPSGGRDIPFFLFYFFFRKSNWSQLSESTRRANARRRAGAERRQPLPKNADQEQYCKAGWVLQVRSEWSVLVYSTRAANAARRAPAKQDCSVKQKNGANYRNRTDDLLITSELLYRLS